MKKQNQFTATAYRELLAKNVETVNVTLPRGFVFKFKKPNFFGMALTSLFQFTSEELEKVIKGEENKTKTLSEAETLRTMMQIRDRVLSHSHTPKIVVGDAQNDELSTEDISNEDLLFLFKWMASGGNIEAGKSIFSKAGK